MRPVPGTDPRFRLLGPFEVDDVDPALLGGPKQHALLATLALTPGAVVSADQLVAALWERPPPSAPAVLQTYISGLRRALEPEHGAGEPWQLIVTRRPGYLLAVPPEQVDVRRFTDLVEAGRSALASGQPTSAADVLRQALALWRGAALSDLGDAPVVRMVAPLEQRRIDALEDRIEADLALGRHVELVPELEALVEQEPLRERLRGQLMVALYRSGRQAHALQVYDACRRILAEELGVDPSPELQRLFNQILRQDQELQVPVEVPAEAAAPQAPEAGRGVPPDLGPSGAPRRRSRSLRRRLVAGMGVVVVAVAAGLLTRAVGPAGAEQLRPGALGLIDLSTGSAEHQVTLGELPSALLVDHGTLWAALSAQGVLAATDASEPDSVRVVTLEPGLAGMAAADGAIWVSQPDAGVVVRVDTESGRVAKRVPVGGRPGDVVVAGGSVWVANRLDDTVTRIDPRLGRVVQTVRVGRDPVAMAGDDHALWVAAAGDATLTRIDLPRATGPQRFRLAGTPRDLVLVDGALWVTDPAAGTLSAVDPQSGAVVQAIRAARGIAGLAAVSGSLVASNLYDGRLVVFDPDTGRERRRLEIGRRPVVAYSDGGRLWAAAALADGSPPQERTLRVLDTRPFEPPDPAWAGGLAVTSLTNDGLVGFRRSSGSDGAQVVPDLATAIPVPVDGGRTWTFRMQVGIRYSTGESVRASDVRPAFERALAAGVPYFGLLVGADRCGNGVCDLSAGIIADNDARSVTFHLVRPDPDFLAELALPVASLVPPGAPPTVLPETASVTDWSRFGATGPYRVLRVADKTVILVRNEEFTAWAPDTAPGGFVDRIEITYEADPEAAVEDVLASRADLALGRPGSRVQELAMRFPTRLVRLDQPATMQLMLDTRRPPFDSLEAREAVAMAVERSQVVSKTRDLVSRVNCQVLPPVLVGYRPYCPYGVGPGTSRHKPELARAAALVRASGTAGEDVVLAVLARHRAVGDVLAHDLRAIGYDVRLDLVREDSKYFSRIADPRTRPNAHLSTWYADVPSASSFAQLARCADAAPGGLNVSGYCDRASETLIERALRLQQASPSDMAAAWQAVDRRLTDTVAWVPLATIQEVVLQSSRVHDLVEVPMVGPAYERMTLTGP